MKRFLLNLMLLAVLVSLVEVASAFYVDLEGIQENDLRAGTVDLVIGNAQWSGDPGAMQTGDSVVLTIPLENAGTLPLNYEVTTSLRGDLASAVEVRVLTPPSRHLDTGASTNVKVRVTLPNAGSAEHEGKSGCLDVTVAGFQASFRDVEISSGHALATEAGPRSIKIVSPADGDEVSGIVTLEAEVTGFDDSSLRVYLKVNRRYVGHNLARPYRVQWDSTRVTSGTYTIKAKAIDRTGQWEMDAITISIP